MIRKYSVAGWMANQDGRERFIGLPEDAIRAEDEGATVRPMYFVEDHFHQVATVKVDDYHMLALALANYEELWRDFLSEIDDGRWTRKLVAENLESMRACLERVRYDLLRTMSPGEAHAAGIAPENHLRDDVDN
jgi:hypothetical protein